MSIPLWLYKSLDKGSVTADSFVIEKPQTVSLRYHFRIRLCFLLAVALLVSALVFSGTAQQNLRDGEKSCGFLDNDLAFTGTPLEQARCLLRPIKVYGVLDEPLKHLPEPLENLIGQPVKFSKEALRRYLAMAKISEMDIGGSLDAPLSRANDNQPAAPLAAYFVIHDVSAPNYLTKEMPLNINRRDWEWNDLQKYWAANRAAHIFINRLGESVTTVDFQTPWRATKLEVKVLKERGKGLFLHTELIQPRQSDPQGFAGNDAIAPTPGFTKAQMERLALVYAAASLRRGVWLIPAFHAAVDAGIAEAHDDPQHFDLAEWAGSLNRLLTTINKVGASKTNN